MPVLQVLGTVTREGALEALKELLAGPIGTDSKIHLYQSSFTPNADSIEADFEGAEADFNTYAPATVTWTAVGIDSVGEAFAMSANELFQNVSGANPNNIGGAWLHVDDAGPPAVDKSVIFFPFPDPVAMTGPLSSMGVKVVITTPNLSGYAVLEF